MTKDEIILHQAKVIEQLEQRIKELEAMLKADSRTSSRPLSSDGLKKKPAFPRKRGGRRGGKPGHEGKTLKMVDHVDHKRKHDPVLEACCCGQSLSGIAVLPSEEKRQVFDLPPRLLEVTEHRVGVKCCPECGKVHQGQYPSGVNAPTQYGPRVRALISLLNVEQSIPVGWISELFHSLTGYELNHKSGVRIPLRSYFQLRACSRRIGTQ